MTKADIARQLRKDHGKEMPTSKLARIGYKKHKLSFRNVEDLRDSLRYIEGKRGKDLKLQVKETDFIVDEKRNTNPYSLPSSDETSYEPYVLKTKRALILSDIHIPYHSIEAITSTFNAAKKEKPDTVVLNGDVLDCFSLSMYVKDPKKRSFAQELLSFKEFFEILQKTFRAKIVFKLGNHEERYQHFLWQKAGELDGVQEFDLENIIKARAEGISVVKDKRIIHAGELDILHGHEFGKSFFSPVSIARGLYLRANANAIQGHNHRSSEYTDTNTRGKIIKTWSTGCLCELHPAYLPINKWNHGFAIVDVDGKNFEVRNKSIYKGKVL